MGTKIKCKLCGDIIEGDKKGHLISCKCNACFIDETDSYYRIGGNLENIEIYDTKTKEFISLQKHNEDLKSKSITRKSSKNLKWKNLNLVFNVVNFDSTRSKLKYFNVLNDKRLIDEIHKKYQKGIIKDYKTLRSVVHQFIIYHYWCKSEYEVYISSLFAKEDKDFIKVDIYTQIMINFDLFIDIIIQGIGFDYKKPKDFVSEVKNYCVIEGE